MKQIIGRKIGMTQVYAEDGTMYAVTVVEVLPNVVTLKKTVEKDGYEAIQVGYEDTKQFKLATKTNLKTLINVKKDYLKKSMSLLKKIYSNSRVMK